MNEDDVRRIAAESVALKQRFFAETASLLVDVGRRIADRLRAGGKVMVFGNGGSAADAQHFAAELVGRYERDRPAYAALALTTDSSALTAIGNDMGYAEVFRRQVEAHARAGDVLIGISTSGRSASVVEALRWGRGRGLLTIGLTGRGGGDIAGLVDHLIDVPHHQTARIQEVHGMVVHILCGIVEDALAA